ncbi:hypothetical protein LOK49_LG06G01018 [Camellia lanceoleosa]|uniref:Uncharacterized protein n=1 Tax=Camellia lanceoleosa TaxID=1840588 RepID=A0ACC0HFB2_9ERIC|nr:hypothetical protein LOK49_LG06G01018 [Camellia lanceoleosa]
MAQSNKDRADAMKAMEENSQNLARNEVSWINNALNEPVNEKIKHTTNAWKVEDSPLNMTVGTGLSSMYSHGSKRRNMTVVKDATNIDSNMLVLVFWTEINFNPSLRAPKTSADSMLLQICNLAFRVLFKCC